MKKAISILAACMLVFALAGMASAQCLTCETDPGNINRGCETWHEQGECATSPFDYEDYGRCTEGFGSYCDTGDPKEDIHRALFQICDCIPDPFQTVTTGQTYDVGMKILVDKKDGLGPVEGDNGVYWAQDVNQSGIPLATYDSQGAACAEEECAPPQGKAFVGQYDYYLANGTTTGAVPYAGSDCDVPDNQEIVEFRAVANQPMPHGYTITAQDSISNNSVWWIDIPWMRVDQGTAQAGWDVYVEICLYETLDEGGVCGSCEGCCCLIKIGTICCDTTPVDETCSDTLIFPYLGKTDGAYWNGVAVTNIGSEDGEAAITLYENGDVFTGTLSIPANSTRVVDVSTLSLTTAGGDGVMGNERSYVKAVTDFASSGFAMMAKESNGVSMGYLAEKLCSSTCGCVQ